MSEESLETMTFREKPSRGWQSFSEFILEDIHHHNKHKLALVSLHQLQSFYIEHNLNDYTLPLPNTFSENASVDMTFEAYRIKRAILRGEYVKLNEDISYVLTEYLNQVFIMAMLYGRVSIVEFFLSRKVINPNCSMFLSPNWPSYFLLACCCDPAVLQVFQGYWINYNISWNGLGPGILSTLYGNKLEKSRDMDYISYNQFLLLNKFKGVTLIHSMENLPIFPLDFACMKGDITQIKYILDNTPEAGLLSRISFIVRCEEHIILVLSRYGFSKKQNFNGNTPLHYSCFRGDFCTLSMQLYLGFPISANKDGLYPNEVGSIKTKEKTSIFFNLCASTPVHESQSPLPVRLFDPQAFRKNMERWMHILNFKESEFDKYVGIFKYLDFNQEHRIFKKSRFSIITVFGLSKTSSTVEKTVVRLSGFPIQIPEFTERELVQKYIKYFSTNEYKY